MYRGSVRRNFRLSDKTLKGSPLAHALDGEMLAITGALVECGRQRKVSKVFLVKFSGTAGDSR